MFRFAFFSLAVAGTMGLALCVPNAADGRSAAPAKQRQFSFVYSATVTDLKPGQTARIWLPVAVTNEDQEVRILKQDLPSQGQMGKEPKYGNSMLYVEAKANDKGEIPVSITYQVTRKEVRATDQDKAKGMEDVGLFLQPDAKVPIGGKPMTLIAGKTLPSDHMQLGKVFYDVVNGHMKYSKEGTGWGQGDAEWACDSKFGNCTDFHSLFIALARSHKIPAKFEMGFSIPEKRGQGDIGGYHCWAKFKPAGGGWVPVDISEANKFPRMKDYYFGNLTEDRVTFTVGRDLTLAPKQDGPALNFLIYPYVEVDGKPYANDKVIRKFSYQDSESAGK